MGEFTNNYNLPEPLYRAICNDTYVKRGDISVTQLIDSPRVRQLKGKHYDEIQEDAIDMVWALFGSATHSIIERAVVDSDRYLSEVQLQMDHLGKILSGTADLYDKETKTLYDFKVTSVWAVTLKNDFWQWEAQLNTYAYMLRLIGYEVETIRIVAILKDWKQGEADRNYSTGKYPSKQISEVALAVYSQKAMSKYIDRRMKAHFEIDYDNLPECNEKERWAKPSTYAVKDPTKKRALKVCSSQKEAEDYIKQIGREGDLIIELRQGKDTRCEGYCSVAPFCSQFKDKKI